MGFESFVNKYGGITTFLGVYSTQQYTSSSALAKDLGFRLLTVLLLYFNMDAPIFSQSKYLETGRKVAGWAGLIFATVSLFDAALRPKYKGLRLLDEVSILCLFTSIFAIFLWLFKDIGEGFGLAVGCLGSSGLVLSLAMRIRESCQAEHVDDSDTEGDLGKVMRDLTNEAQGNPEALMNLRCLVFLLMSINAEDKNAIALLKFLKPSQDTQSATGIPTST